MKEGEISPGNKFGNWTVLYKSKNKKRYWICECSCKDKTIKEVAGYTLINGDSTSCGCIRKFLVSIDKRKYNKYIFENDLVKIYIENIDDFGIIDKEDFDKIKKYRWYGGGFNKRYLQTSAYENPRRKIQIHRIIMEVENDKSVEIDHINRNPLDNRKINLRKCTHSQNSRNTNILKNNKSGFIGVFFDNTHKKWVAKIEYNAKQISLGHYNKKEDAVVVRLKSEKKYFKEFAPQRHLFEEYGIK